MSDPDAEYISLYEAARRLGVASRAVPTLRKRIEAKEREHGLSIFHRKGGDRRVHRRVTLHALRRYLPEVFSPLAEDKDRIQVQAGLVFQDQIQAYAQRISLLEESTTALRELLDALGTHLRRRPRTGCA